MTHSTVQKTRERVTKWSIRNILPDGSLAPCTGNALAQSHRALVVLPRRRHRHTVVVRRPGAGRAGGDPGGASDTTSVEQVTRTANRVVSDAVGRSPIVVRRRWEATLAPDGSVRHWTMHTHIPNVVDGATDLHHEALFSDSTVRLIRRTNSDTTDVT